jgi:hypothetical protein
MPLSVFPKGLTASCLPPAGLHRKSALGWLV